MITQIRAFIVENQGFDRGEIRLDTRIEKDLKITGDDAVEFLIAFGKRFNVDISNFKAADYFAAEGTVSLPVVWGLHSGGRKTLTIEHLIKSIKAGRLDENVIAAD